MLDIAYNEHKNIIIFRDLNTNFQNKRSYQPLHVLITQYQLKQITDSVTRPMSGKTTDLTVYLPAKRIMYSIRCTRIGMRDHLPNFISRKINARMSNKQGIHTTISYRRKKVFIASDFDIDLAEGFSMSFYEIFNDSNDISDIKAVPFYKRFGQVCTINKASS